MQTDLRKLAQDVMAAQPFTRHLDARLERFEDGYAELAVDIDDRHRQQFGLVHGGVWCYAADNALTFAAGSVLGPSVVTGGLSIDYLRGARSGRLVARATVVHHDARQAVCRVDLGVIASDDDFQLCAVATGRAFATQPTSRPS